MPENCKNSCCILRKSFHIELAAGGNENVKICIKQQCDMKFVLTGKKNPQTNKPIYQVKRTILLRKHLRPKKRENLPFKLALEQRSFHSKPHSTAERAQSYSIEERRLFL